MPARKLLRKLGFRRGIGGDRVYGEEEEAEILETGLERHGVGAGQEASIAFYFCVFLNVNYGF